MKAIIIGGVAGGASAAARLRRLDESAEIILLERGDAVSYANCGLPYYIGGEIADRGALSVQTPQGLRDRFRIDVRIRSEAVAIDRAGKTVSILDHATGKTCAEPYDKLVLSPGAAPIRPPIPGIDGDRVFTLRSLGDAFAIKDFIKAQRPRSAAVLGGGYIGVEMAENLTRAGLEVSLIEMRGQILAPFDPEMTAALERHMRDHGVRLLLGSPARAIERDADGLRIVTPDGDVRADLVIAALGVRPEAVLAKEAGLAVGERGGIVVDDHLRTADPDIYAVGDAIEVADFVSGERTLIPLAGPANRQGRIAADNIAGAGEAYKGTQGSSILRVFDMTAAATGINEKTASRLGIPCEKSYTHSGSHAGYFPGGQTMTIKLLFHPDGGKVLGAQIIGGEGVDKRCDVLATAIRFGATIDDLTELELCYAPPYSSSKDPVNIAGYTAQNILEGETAVFHWHDVAALQSDPCAMLIDVRTPREYAAGHIDGAVNIPVDDLRGRMRELDPGKTLCIICEVGVRGHAACRLLSQHGFTCRNLSGGDRLYRMIFGR